jgi:hypothetical protein
MNSKLFNSLKTTLLFSMIMVILFNGVVFDNAVFAQSRNTNKSSKSSNLETSPINAIPYLIEATEESTKKGLIITLAVEQVTIIRCPEEPLQILFGNNEGIDVSETKPGRTEIYLRPRVSSINTNVVIEMASGPIMLYLRTVEIKGGAKVGQFTAEVMVKNSAYKEALIKTRDELALAQKEIVDLKSNVDKLSIELKEKNTALCQEEKRDLLRIVEVSLQNKQKRNIVSILGGKAKIGQVGNLQRTNRGLLLNISIENTGKDFLSINDITCVGANIVGNGLDNIRRVAPKSELNYSFLIELNQSNNTNDDFGVSARVDANATNSITSNNPSNNSINNPNSNGFMDNRSSTTNIPSELTLIVNQTPVKLKIS